MLRSFHKLTAAGPSGMRVQHLLDVPLPTHTYLYFLASCHKCSSSWKSSTGVGYLSLRSKLDSSFKEQTPSDIHPIAVGGVLRRIPSKCLCHLIRVKAADFFQPLQLGVACPQGVEKIVHHLRSCIEDHCFDKDFVVLKVDMINAGVTSSRS